MREADRTFQTIRGEAELYLANAHNGLGSVTLLNGQVKEALRLINKALELVPDHPFALHDRAEALRFAAGSEPQPS